MRFLNVPSSFCAHAHAHTHTHAHAHAHTRTHTRARTHAHTHTRTHVRAKIPKFKIAHFIFQKSFYSKKGDPDRQASGGTCLRRQISLKPNATAADF